MNAFIGSFPVVVEHVGIGIHEGFISLCLHIVHTTTTQLLITGYFTYKEVTHVGELMLIVHGGIDAGHHLHHLFACAREVGRGFVCQRIIIQEIIAAGNDQCK